jgi:MscS family membrane protein
MRLETLSARDRFLFHPVVGVRYETTPLQLQSFMTSVRTLLDEHANVDSVSVRVRFVKFGASSLDVDIFAYVFAPDWNNFLEIQEELLLGIMDMVQKEGAGIALPSQTLYLETDKADKLGRPVRRYSGRTKADAMP